MRHLNPYVHTCADQPGLVCPACKWTEERQRVDVLVCDEGTIWLFNPLSERAKAWVAEHVAAESWQWLCDAVAVEHRYARAIVEAMLGHGFVLRAQRRHSLRQQDSETMTVDPNVWASSEAWDALDALLLPYVEALTPAQLAQLGESMSKPIIHWVLWIDSGGEVHYGDPPLDADAGSEETQ